MVHALTANGELATDPAWQRRAAAIAAFAVVCFAGVLIGLDPIPQKLAYHAFADGRALLGIPNFQNVVSNLPFLLVGLAGLHSLRQWDTAIDPELHPAYLTLFFGLVATAIGSAYYHWTPTSETLFWDRLPIAVAFMGLFAAILGERMGPSIGARLLLPVALYGAASVIYWRITDDLRPYAIAQFFPLLAIPLLLLLFPARFTRGPDLLVAIGFYVAAKALEEVDHTIFGLGQITSGHTLKHLAAAMGAWWLVRMLRLRLRL
ncbi:MAG: ceramidase domain-containing protein [Hyphomicrobiaceae bacterium]